jgi:hypothetical protein
MKIKEESYALFGIKKRVKEKKDKRNESWRKRQ